MTLHIKIIPKYKKSNSSPQEKGKEVANPLSFGGLNPSRNLLSLDLQYKKLCSKDEFQKILDLLDPSYKNYFEHFLSDLKATIKDKPHLFSSMPESIKAEIADGHIIARPQKSRLGRLIEAISAPVTGLVKVVKNKLGGDISAEEQKKLQEINTKFANLEGLVEYVSNLKEKDPEVVKKLIREKIKNNFKKIKANYSSNLSSTLTDLATFLLAAGFNGCDFYNITRKSEDNHAAAMKEAKLKVKQDFIRMGVLTYLTYVITSLFKKDCNKSMTRMLAVASLIQLVSEIITRKATGRPVLPFNNETLKTYKATHKDAENKDETATKGAKPSFKGNFMKTIVVFDKDELAKILDLTKRVDGELAKRYIDLIEGKTPSAFKNSGLKEIPLGEKESTIGKVLRCIFIPITAPVKFIKKLINKGKSEVDDFIEIRNYLSFVKNLLKTKYKGKDLVNNKESFEEFKNDIINASLASFRTTEASYNTANYSIIKRVFSYMIFTAFMATDAYNVSMLHNNGDKKNAITQAKQRIIQEVTRFFISIYTASANLTMFGGLYNKTLGNAFGLTAMTSSLNNILTRKVLGRPILPTDKKHLDEQDQKNENSEFHKFINRVVIKGK